MVNIPNMDPMGMMIDIFPPVMYNTRNEEELASSTVITQHEGRFRRGSLLVGSSD